VILPAAINVACTLAVLSVGARRRAFAAATAALVFAIAIPVVAFWPQQHHGPRLPAELLTYSAIVGVTWIPGAILAVLASGRPTRSRIVLSIAAVLISAALGGAFLYTALAMVCSILGDCP